MELEGGKPFLTELALLEKLVVNVKRRALKMDRRGKRKGAMVQEGRGASGGEFEQGQQKHKNT